MEGHHLVMGELVDFLSAQTLPDTHDERYRQKIARWLVETKGHPGSSITARHPLHIRAGTKEAIVPVTFTVSVDRRIAMLVQYGPGSLTTRHRAALAMSRLVAPYQVPVVVVSNGEQADVLDGVSGKALGAGMDAIPSRVELMALARNSSWPAIDAQRAEREARIVMAFEVDDSCPCDTTICKVKE